MNYTPIVCPRCNREMQVPYDMVGSIVTCPYCGATVQTYRTSEGGWKMFFKKNWGKLLISLAVGVWLWYQMDAGTKEREEYAARMDQKWNALSCEEKHLMLYIADFAGFASDYEDLMARIKYDKEVIKARAKESEERGERILRPYWWNDKWQPVFNLPFKNYEKNPTPDYLLYKRNGWFDGFQRPYTKYW